MFAARHFWNACLPLLGSPHDREQFKEPTKIILKNINKAESKNKQVRISERYCLFLVIGTDGKETSKYLSWESEVTCHEHISGFLPAVTYSYIPFGDSFHFGQLSNSAKYVICCLLFSVVFQFMKLTKKEFLENI